MLPSFVQKGAKMTIGFVFNLCLSWINNRFIVAAVKRDLMNAWMSTMIDTACNSVGGRSPPLVATTASALLHLVPTDRTIAAVLRSVYHSLVEPGMRSRDAAAAQYDG
jgi:hypothetical protein